MTEAIERTAVRTPMHLWIVGLLGLVWNAFGAFDYFMTRTRREAWIDAMMPGVDGRTYMRYIDGFPLWVSTAWGFGVWGGLVGAVLLLMRRRLAEPVLLVSLIGAVLGIGYQIARPVEIAGMNDGANAIAPYAVIVIAALLYAYARAQRLRGRLR